MPTTFQMPTPVSIMGRSSSITNSFINAIIPVVLPTEDELREALSILQMSADDLRCAYCGDRSTEWDHLRPLVVNQRPTGYISEIGNLVPACGKCNQSKGNKPWRSWMEGTAPQSPKTRGVLT
jgi:5-methylcytosine-specific restriction endonuclease McrA